MVAPSDEVGEQGHLHEHFSQLTPSLQCVLLADGGARYWLKQYEWSANSKKVSLRACGPTLSQGRGSSKSRVYPMASAKHVGHKRHELGSLSGVTMLPACSSALSTLTLAFAAH